MSKEYIMEEPKMRKNVLLVDDESSVRRSLSLGLTQEGYTIEPCENGVNALKIMYEHNQNQSEFDAVILDIRLPDIDGIKLAKMFKSSYPETNIIFITGYSDNIILREIQELESTKILKKPFTAHELSLEIEEFGEHKYHQEITQKSQKQITTFSAYAMLKLAKSANYLDIYRKLYFNQNVLYCDAIRGEYDIIMLMQSNSFESFNAIIENDLKSIEGISEIDFFRVEEPILDEGLMSFIHTANEILSIDTLNSSKREFHNVVCSYVTLNVEKSKLDILYPTLFFDDNVVYCDFTDSKENQLVLLIHGTQYSEISNVISSRIAVLDGVLSLKEYPIINIFEV